MDRATDQKKRNLKLHGIYSKDNSIPIRYFLSFLFSLFQRLGRWKEQLGKATKDGDELSTKVGKYYRNLEKIRSVVFVARSTHSNIKEPKI